MLMDKISSSYMHVKKTTVWYHVQGVNNSFN